MPASMLKHVVMFSGGIGSWAAAKRVIEANPADEVVGLFADTLIEDEDLYRFLIESAEAIGLTLEVLAEGHDPWQIFFKKRFLGNSLVDPCSRILKREFLRNWLDTNGRTEPGVTTIYLGIDWSEEHRFKKAAGYWAPWNVAAPLCDRPYLTKTQMISQLDKYGVKPPRLYAMGFAHNNCGGFCVKAGQGHFKILLEKMPERYAYHEAKEQEFQKFIGSDVTIMREQVNGVRRRLSLKELRERIQAGQKVDQFDIGGCGCMSEPEGDGGEE